MAERIGTAYIGGARHYIHPETGEKAPGVTSILGQLPKPFLVAWAAKMAASYAVDNAASVLDIASRDHDAAVDLIKGASKRHTATAANVGTEVHDFLEARLLGNPTAPLSARAAEYVPAIDAWFLEWKPEPVLTEASVWGHCSEGVYAGSFDGVIKVAGETLLIDWKAGKSVYADASIQLACYRYATELIGGGAIPEVDACAVIHVRPEFVKVYPMAATRDKLEVFSALYKVWRWGNESKSAMGKPLLHPPTPA